MLNYISHKNNENRIKYCVYRVSCGKAELIAMTANLSRIEALIGFNFSVKLSEVILTFGDSYFEKNYLIKAEHFIY